MRTSEKIPVLDHGFVQLIDMMGDSDLDIVNAARTSFLGASKGEEKDKRLLKYLYKNMHFSPFEQVSFKWMMRMPLVAIIHFLRYRTAKINSESARYVEPKDEFYMPVTFRLQSEDNKQGSGEDCSPELNEKYLKLLEKSYKYNYSLYKSAVEDGIAKEQARLFLNAYGMYQTIIFTIDARNMLNLFKQRLHPNAQYETRQFASAMFQVFKEKLPWTTESL